MVRRSNKCLKIMNQAEMRDHLRKNLSNRRRLKRRKRQRRKKKEKKKQRKKESNQMKKRLMIKIQKMKLVNMPLLRTRGNQRPKASSLFQQEKLLQKKKSLMIQLKRDLQAQ